MKIARWLSLCTLLWTEVESQELFGATARFPTGPLPVAVQAADLNGDGSIDLITANEGDGTVAVLYNNGRGSFDTLAAISIEGGTNQQISPDFRTRSPCRS